MSNFNLIEIGKMKNDKEFIYKNIQNLRLKERESDPHCRAQKAREEKFKEILSSSVHMKILKKYDYRNLVNYYKAIRLCLNLYPM